jgi:hypothetical protein
MENEVREGVRQRVVWQEWGKSVTGGKGTTRFQILNMCEIVQTDFV